MIVYGLRTVSSYRRDAGSAASPLGASGDSVQLEVLSGPGPDLSDRRPGSGAGVRPGSRRRAGWIVEDSR